MTYLTDRLRCIRLQRRHVYRLIQDWSEAAKMEELKYNVRHETRTFVFEYVHSRKDVQLCNINNLSYHCMTFTYDCKGRLQLCGMRHWRV